MPTIIAQSGKTFHVTGDFVIRPEVSFTQVAVLSEGLPSSVEGRAAFRIVEEVIATVQTKFISKTFMGDEGADEVLSSNTVYGLVASTSNDVESSSVYARMTDDSKKKMQLRLRKLLEAVAEKEAIESNAALLDSSATTQGVDEKIAETTFKINRLLGVYSNKPFIEMQDLSKGVEAFVASGVNAEAINSTQLTNILGKEAKEHYKLLA